jgi:hypothetical protein
MSCSATTGKRYRFRDQEYWAESGLVHIENRHTGDYKCLSRAEAFARAVRFNEELKYDHDGTFYPDERTDMYRLVHSLLEVCQDAKYQGDPMDPVAAKQRAKESRKVSVLFDMGKKQATSDKLIVARDASLSSLLAVPESARYRAIEL